MQVDYLVIGAGISGAAAAYELALAGSVLMIEAETAPGYHSTGRSAALYTRNYGGPIVRLISQASYDFFLHPPAGFAERPLLTPRGSLTIAAPGEEARLEAILAVSMPGHEIDLLSASDAHRLAPLMRADRVGAAAYEPGVMDIDVAALHHGYLRGFKQRGGRLLCGKRIDKLEHRDGDWHATSGDYAFSARVIVNAAGAWAGQIGALAGAAEIGLMAKRRTAIIVEPPAGLDVGAMPAVDFVGSDAYFKPDAGRIMASPGDQTPIEPQDVQPDELDIAVLVDWLEHETTLSIRRIASSWAGLRSFVADDVPVVGFDDKAPDFFWLAGQGGYGIMMAPTLGRAAAGLISTGTFPSDLRTSGIVTSALAPSRLYGGPTA